MSKTVKRGARFNTTLVSSRYDLSDIFDQVLETLDFTDEHFPVKWDTIQFHTSEGGFRITVETEEPPTPQLLMDVEPTLQLHSTPGTNALRPRGDLNTTKQPEPEPEQPAGWSDTLATMRGVK